MHELSKKHWKETAMKENKEATKKCKEDIFPGQSGKKS